MSELAPIWEQVDDEARTAGLVDPDSLGAWMDARDLPGSGEPVELKFQPR